MKISGAQGSSGVVPVLGSRSITPPTSSAPARPASDPVTLSTTARAREAASQHPRFGALSAAAHRDPKLASQLASEYATCVHQPIIDCSEWPYRYAATGEVWTPARDAHYAKLAQGLQAASSALYDQELAKGTDPADIIDKLVALGDTYSEELRDIVDWDLKLA